MTDIATPDLQNTESPGWLDRTVASLFTWNWETIAWLALLVVAAVIRLADLGPRSMSHDESEHAWFAYNLYAGKGYEHNPIYHGPFIYHVMALFYLLFGDNDVTARVPTALFGLGIVAMMIPMRRWLGRYGAYLAAVLVTFSPALLHYSRHTRHDIYELFWAVVFIYGAFRYLETDRDRPAKWLYLVAAGLSLALASKEDAFIHGGLVGGFLLLIVACRWFLWRFNPDYPEAEREVPLANIASRDWLVLAGLVAVSLAGVAVVRITGLGSGTFDTAGVAGTLQTLLRLVPMLVPPAIAIGLAVWYAMRQERSDEPPAVFSSAMDLVILLGTLILPWLSPFLIRALGYDPLDYTFPGGILGSLSVLLGMAGIAVVVGVLWNRRRWVVAAALFYAIFFLLFTTFFTNGKGWATGLVGSLGYWLSQQGVSRGSQPWYYYFLIVPLYEFLPLVLSIPVLFRALFRRNGLSIALLVGFAATGLPALAIRLAALGDPQAVSETVATAGRLLGYLSMLFGLAATGWGGLSRFPGRRQAFLAFLPFFVLGSWGVYVWAGEKMPWLVTSITLPMCIAGGWWLGQVMERVDWRAVWRQGGVWIAVLMVPLLAALLALVRGQPFQDRSIEGLSATSQWLAALVIGAIAVVLIVWLANRLGWVQARRVIGLTLVLIMGLWMLRTTYMLNFINYDYVKEYLFYAHASPDPRMVMDEVEAMSRRTVGDKQLKVAYDDDASWPFNWYLRDWPRAVYFGANPSRDAFADAAVAIVGSKNVDAARPYLQRDYNEYSHRLIWWPDESYKITSLQKIWEELKDPAKRQAFLDVVLWREFPNPMSEWPLVHRFSLFVRKDLASQMWDYGAMPAAAAVPADPYEQGFTELANLQTIGSGPGTAAGQLNFPRNVAVAGDGTLYVADTGNHRIQVFGADGGYLQDWGSPCELYTEGQPGCTDLDGAGPMGYGDGQFSEPWGIAIGPDGNVYVADTWNHRIQVFDAEGRFIGKWGDFATTNGEAVGSPGSFWGPRAVVVDDAGLVYVSDTGNKRIQVFDSGGGFLGQFGGGGVVEGRFDEPVGLAIIGRGTGVPGGMLYVADTWNRRIQKFDVSAFEGVPSFTFAEEWPIEGWSSQSVVNKPYLAVSAGQLYVTDPENWRVLVFNSEGEFKATFGQYGSEPQNFLLPVGIAVGPNRNVYVADSDNHRVSVFPPVP